MPYCTLDDIKKRIPEADLIQLTDDEDTGEIAEAVVADIIAGAGELVDGHLRRRYALPLATVPGMIKAIAVDISAYELFARRPTFKVPETVEKKYLAQLKILKEIKNGVIELGIDGASTPEVTTPEETTLVSTGDAMFSSDVLDRY